MNISRAEVDGIEWFSGGKLEEVMMGEKLGLVCEYFVWFSSGFFFCGFGGRVSLC